MFDFFKSFFDDPRILEYVGNLAMSAILSGLIGLERGFHGRAAGMRTNILVGLGACLFTTLSTFIAFSGQIVTLHGVGAPDPGRISAQIVTGIGFLGAGAIIKSGINIRGLTTASCMWIVAGIGMACGSGHIVVAVIATFLAIIVLTSVSIIENMLPSHSYRSIKIKLTADNDTSKVIDAVKEFSKLQHVNFKYNSVQGEYSIVANVRIFKRNKTDVIFDKIYKRIKSVTNDVISIQWTLQS